MDAKGVTVAPVLSARFTDHPYGVGRELFSEIPDAEMKNCPVRILFPDCHGLQEKNHLLHRSWRNIKKKS